MTKLKKYVIIHVRLERGKLRIEGAKRYKAKKRQSSPMGRLTRRVIGKQMVIRYSEGMYQINPEGSGTRTIDPEAEQTIISRLAFSPRGRFPIVPTEIVQAGIPISFEGF